MCTSRSGPPLQSRLLAALGRVEARLGILARARSGQCLRRLLLQQLAPLGLMEAWQGIQASSRQSRLPHKLLSPHALPSLGPRLRRRGLEALLLLQHPPRWGHLLRWALQVAALLLGSQQPRSSSRAPLLLSEQLPSPSRPSRSNILGALPLPRHQELLHRTRLLHKEGLEAVLLSQQPHSQAPQLGRRGLLPPSLPPQLPRSGLERERLCSLQRSQRWCAQGSPAAPAAQALLLPHRRHKNSLALPVHLPPLYLLQRKRQRRLTRACCRLSNKLQATQKRHSQLLLQQLALAGTLGLWERRRHFQQRAEAWLIFSLPQQSRLVAKRVATVAAWPANSWQQHLLQYSRLSHHSGASQPSQQPGPWLRKNLESHQG